MGRVPQNQDELARAILSGKLSLEDLRLEQARRQAAAQAARAGLAAQRPAVPGAKPANPSPYGSPVAPTRRQVLTPSQQPSPVTRRTPAAVPATRPPAARQPQTASAVKQPAAAATGQRAATAAKTLQPAQAAPNAYALPHATERHGMFSVQNLRRAIIMSELLAKPLALREG